MQDGTCVGRGCVHTGPFPAGLGLEPPLGPPMCPHLHLHPLPGLSALGAVKAA